MSAQPRAVARRDEMSAAWFEGLAADRLLMRACPDGHLSRPDVLACDVCGRIDLGWREASRRGSVVAVAVDHSSDPATRLVIVELAEGPWLTTCVEGGHVDRGDAVMIDIVHPGEGEPYPVARPVSVA